MFTNQKFNRTMTIVFGTLFIADMVGYILIMVFNVLKEAPIIFPLMIVFSLLIFISLSFYFLLRWMNARMLFQNVKSMNKYSFNLESTYFNRSVFESIVTSLRKRHRYKKMSQSIVIFSGTPQSVMSSGNRRASIISFNARVITFLDQYFTSNRQYGKVVYCYDEGNFLIYLFGDNRLDIINMINAFNEKLYRIVEDNNIHVMVTPYFGVAEVSNKDSLIEAIENASLARRISERNFELVNFYRSGLRETIDQNETDEIIRGLDQNEFVVYYQPKFDLIRERFISSEALIRWKHPKRGILPPGAFVPQANAAGLSHDLDVYVFNKVCEDLAITRKKGRRLLPVSLNFSLYEFYSPHFLEFLIETMKKYSIDPRLIQIEILETTSQANPFMSVSIIKQLQNIGIRVLMDDFGIGYSNIGNLNKIPFDAIKIDKSYIDTIIENKRSRQIVQCLVDLGKISGMEVIAEGVDNINQVNILKKMGCDTIQGFYYSRPISKEDFDKFLLENKFEYKEEMPL